MIEQPGTVIRVDGGDAWVETERRSSCSDCSAKVGCGHAILGKALGRRFNIVRVPSVGELKTGDCVVLGLREEALLRSSFAVYLVPLAGLLAGVLGGSLLAAEAGGDLTALIGGVAGLLLGLSWVRVFGSRAIRLQAYQPVILRRLGSASS